MSSLTTFLRKISRNYNVPEQYWAVKFILGEVSEHWEKVMDEDIYDGDLDTRDWMQTLERRERLLFKYHESLIRDYLLTLNSEHFIDDPITKRKQKLKMLEKWIEIIELQLKFGPTNPIGFGFGSNQYSAGIYFSMPLNEQLITYKGLQEKLNGARKKTIKPHDKEFADGGWELFQDLLANGVEPIVPGKRTNGRYSDLSYFYRMLDADDYIRVSQTAFQKWFNTTFHEENWTKVKTLAETDNPMRRNAYSLALERLKKRSL